jgi:mRNA-degrading endonuclease toxin of MazEF toxin-antitoxin module
MSTPEWRLSPGHVVYATIPYSDIEGNKERFGIVVSTAEFNETHPEIIVAFSTRSSNIKHPRDYDVVISEHHDSFSLTRLPESTTVRCGRLWTINKDKILDCPGCVPDDILNDIQKLVISCFPEA